MSDAALTGLFGLLGVIITALLAPTIKTWFDRRRTRAGEDKADRTTAAHLLDKTLDRVLNEQARLRDQLNDEIKERDTRISALETKVEALQAEIRGYIIGMAAPQGWISIPHHIWRTLPEGVKEQFPGRPYPGEDASFEGGAPRFSLRGEVEAADPPGR